jgi:hypothetical protein
MNKTMRHGIFGAALLAGALLIAAAALGNSVHDEGQFGGSWSKIEPNAGYGQRRHAGRVGPLYSGRYYTAPAPYAFYEPRGYYTDPYYYDYRPGAGFGVTIR